jgi:hypothetical protein
LRQSRLPRRLSSLFQSTSHIAGASGLIRNLLNPAVDIRGNVNQLDVLSPYVRQIFDRRLVDQADVGQIDPCVLMLISRMLQKLPDRLATIPCQSAGNIDGDHATLGLCCCDPEHLICSVYCKRGTNNDGAGVSLSSSHLAEETNCLANSRK